MLNSELKMKTENVCNLQYLIDMMGNKKPLINGIMNSFLEQIPQELKSIEDAIAKTDYAIIKSFAHTMKSSVSIMGISNLTPILQEMENLSKAATGIEKIKELNLQLNSICKQAIKEIETEKINYA